MTDVAATGADVDPLRDEGRGWIVHWPARPRPCYPAIMPGKPNDDGFGVELSALLESWAKKAEQKDAPPVDSIPKIPVKRTGLFS